MLLTGKSPIWRPGMANQAVVAGGAFVGNSHCPVRRDYGAAIIEL
jgi:hypothetical protein